MKWIKENWGKIQKGFKYLVVIGIIIFILIVIFEGFFRLSPKDKFIKEIYNVYIPSEEFPTYKDLLEYRNEMSGVFVEFRNYPDFENLK